MGDAERGVGGDEVLINVRGGESPDRDADRSGITSGRTAECVEAFETRAQRGGVDVGGVPDVGVGNGASHRGVGLAAHPDRWAGSLHRHREQRHAVDLTVSESDILDGLALGLLEQ